MIQFVIRAHSQERIKEAEFFVCLFCFRSPPAEIPTVSRLSVYSVKLIVLWSPHMAASFWHIHSLCHLKTQHLAAFIPIFHMLKPTNASSSCPCPWLNLACYHSFKDLPLTCYHYFLPKQHKSSARLRKEKGREEKNHKILMAPGISCIFISISLKKKNNSNSICYLSKDYLTIRDSLNNGLRINLDCQYYR